MLKIFQDTHSLFQDEIRKLYVKTFSKGDHAQDIDPTELDLEIRLTYQEGMMMVATEESQLTGALFVYPLQYDASCATILPGKMDCLNAPYIAQLMVEEGSRGKGIGYSLLMATLKRLQQNQLSEVFIRVWTKNLNALNLYKKAGFQEIGSIHQTVFSIKKQADWVMEKVYMKKNLLSTDAYE